jgi:magnesium transporter
VLAPESQNVFNAENFYEGRISGSERLINQMTDGKDTAKISTEQNESGTGTGADMLLNRFVKELIQTNAVRLRADETIEASLQRLRAEPFQGQVVYFYVVDSNSRLQGVVSARDLLLGSPDSLISELMNRRVVKINGNLRLIDAIDFFSLYPYLAFPVVDSDGHFLGTLNSQIYRDGLTEIAEDEDAQPDQELYELIGLNPSDTRRGGVGNAVRQRLPWLFSNVAGGLFAALVADSYKDLLDRVVLLALFVPVVLSLSESIAMQSATLGIESGQAGPLTWGRLRRLIRREFFTSFFLAISCGMMVAILGTFWQSDFWLGTVLMISMGLSMVASALLALLLPLALHSFQLNPSLAAGPLALVFADLTTLTIYFRIGLTVWPE